MLLNILFYLNEYLGNHSKDKNYKKCESISIIWFIYSDKNFLYYDNSINFERATFTLYNNM